MGIESKNDQECLIMGKGVAFGKKVGQTVERQRKLSSLFRHCVWSLPMRCWIRQKRNLESLTVPFFLPWQTILISLSAVYRTVNRSVIH